MRQLGRVPEQGEYQLKNFGALKPWKTIFKLLNSSPEHRLLIMIRHGQAWENLNPTSNSNCEFNFEGKVIQNFDSSLTPLGKVQSETLNILLKSPSLENPRETWFEALGLNKPSTTFLTSPLTRTLQTSQIVFSNLPIVSSDSERVGIVAHELLRAGIGQAVCNFRLNAHTPTESNILPKPWRTGCNETSRSYLEKIYNSEASPVKFRFPVRPPGGKGFGLVADSDALWRSDITEDDVILTRARAFLAQVFENTNEGSVTVAVTHGEIIGAVFNVTGQVGYNATNTEVVPLLLTYERSNL